MPSFAKSPAFLFVAGAILRDWRFLSITVLSCTVAAMVASFQFVVFTSFLLTGSVVPRAIGADAWVVARTVECFDFPDTFSEDYSSSVAAYLPGAQFRRVAFGFVTWRSPGGRRGNVAVVGIDDSNLPVNGFAVDRSDLSRLDLGNTASDAIQATVGGVTLFHAQTVDNIPTFLGAPYLLVSFETAREILRMDPSSVSFLAADFDGEAPPLTQPMQQLEAFPDIALLSSAEFENSSSRYWQRKTGAGAAILLAAVLAALLMVILLTNGILRFIQRYHEDLLSLIGHGGKDADILRIVGMVAGFVALASAIGATVLTPLCVLVTKSMLPWVAFRPLDMIAPILAIGSALVVVVIAARRAVAAYGPEAMYRS